MTTQSTTGLVERLRDITFNGTPRCVVEAADLLSTQDTTIAELVAALEEIKALDYTRAAVSGCAFTAHRIATDALTKARSAT